MKHFILLPLAALALWGSGCATNGPVAESVSRTPTDTYLEASKVETTEGRTVTTEETVKRVHSTGVVVD